MTIRLAWALGLSFVLVSVGCQRAPSNTGTDGTDTGDDSTLDETVLEDALADDTSDETADETSDEPVLTEEAAYGIEVAADAAGALGASTTAVLPASEAQELIGQTAQSLSTCPEITWAASLSEFSLTLDWGEGCNPVVYPDATVSGAVEGSISIANGTLSLTFNEFTFDDRMISGTFVGTTMAVSGSLTTEATVDLTAGDSGTLAGYLMADVEMVTGIITIHEATVTVMDSADEDFQVVFSDVVIDPKGNGNLIPESGTATFDVENTGSGPETLTVVVEFTESTPTDGTVLVSIGGSSPVAYTLGD